MDLTQPANLGEFIGGMAVLVTLVHLALQVRQSVKQLRVSSLQAAVLGYQQRIEVITDNEKHSQVFLAGLRDLGSLPPGKRLKFHGILTGTVSVFENNLNLYRAGALPAEQLAVYERDIVALLKSPGASLWWVQVKEHYFSVAVCEHVDRLLRSAVLNVSPLCETLEQFLGLDENETSGGSL